MVRISVRVKVRVRVWVRVKIRVSDRAQGLRSKDYVGPHDGEKAVALCHNSAPGEYDVYRKTHCRNLQKNVRHTII